MTILGTSFGYEQHLTDYARERHVFCIGQTGSGSVEHVAVVRLDTACIPAVEVIQDRPTSSATGGSVARAKAPSQCPR